MADARIKFIVELIDKFSGKSKKVTEELKKTDKAAEQADKSVSKLETAFKLAGTAALTYLAVNSIKAVVALNDLRLESDRADRALIAFAGGSEEAAAALDAVVEAGDGIVSKLEASRNAAKLFSMGLAETAEEAGNLTEMAITLGSAMGKDAAQSFEEFSLLLANMSIPRLDTFGISASQVRARIRELKEETAGLSREQAFMTAVTEIGADSLDKLKEAGFEAGDETGRLKASWEDLKLSLADSVDIEDTIGFMDEVVDNITKMVDVSKLLRDAVDNGTISWRESNKMMEEARRAGDDYAGMIEELTLLEAQNTENAVGGHRRRRQAIEEGIVAQGEYNMSLREEIDLLGGVNANLADNIDKMKEQIEWIEAGGLVLQKQAEEAWNAYLDGATSATQAMHDLNVIQVEALNKMGEFDLMDFDEVVDKIRGDLNVTLWEARRLAGEILSSLSAIDGLKAHASVTISTSGNIPSFGAGMQQSVATTQQSGRTMIMPPSAANETGNVSVSAGEKVEVTSKSSTFAEALQNTLGSEDGPERAGRAMARELIASGVFG